LPKFKSKNTVNILNHHTNLLKLAFFSLEIELDTITREISNIVVKSSPDIGLKRNLVH